MRKSLVFLSVVVMTVVVSVVFAFAGDGDWKKSEWQFAGGQETGWLLAEGAYQAHLEACKEQCKDVFELCKVTGQWDDGTSYGYQVKNGNADNWCAGKRNACNKKCIEMCPVKD